MKREDEGASKESGLPGFHKRLRQLRKANGFTQRQVAIAVDVDTQRVTAWESGGSGLTVELLHRLAMLFGVHMEWLAYGKGQKEREPRARADPTGGGEAA